MGSINRLCRGLLQLLDSQNQGVNPTTLGEEIRPVLDVHKHILLAKGLTYANGEAIVVGSKPLGSFAGFYNQPNSGEIWWLKEVSIQLYTETSTVDLVCNVSCDISQPGVGDFYIPFARGQQTLGLMQAADQFNQVTWSYVFSNNDLVPMIPGQNLLFNIDYVSAVPAPANSVTAYIGAAYYVLPW